MLALPGSFSGLASRNKMAIEDTVVVPYKEEISVRDQSLILRMELFFHHLSHKAIARCHATQEGGIKMIRNPSHCTKIFRPFFDQPTCVCF